MKNNKVGNALKAAVSTENVGKRMVLGTVAIIGTYAVGAIAYDAGKKAICTAMLATEGIILLAELVDGVRVNKRFKKVKVIG